MSMRRPRAETASADETPELAALADGSLVGPRRRELEERVASSSELADRLREQQRAVAMTRSAVGDVQASESLRLRIEAERRAHGRRAPRRLMVVTAGAVAAVAAVAIGLTVFNSAGSETRFRAALAATDLAPGASGTATLTRTSSGWRIELDARGLPRRGGATFYEAWLKNPAGTLVPIGTFNEGRDVTLWAGVSPTRFMTLTVTRERADGDQSSSGEKVLVGSVQRGR
jgi:hypothetical protein